MYDGNDVFYSMDKYIWCKMMICFTCKRSKEEHKLEMFHLVYVGEEETFNDFLCHDDLIKFIQGWVIEDKTWFHNLVVSAVPFS